MTETPNLPASAWMMHYPQFQNSLNTNLRKINFIRNTKSSFDWLNVGPFRSCLCCDGLKLDFSKLFYLKLSSN